VIDLLFGLDKAVFVFINQTIANPAGDLLWPLITNYDRLVPLFAVGHLHVTVSHLVLLGIAVLLIVKGGARGRIAVIMVFLTLAAADQVSSSVIKPFVDRPRPCSPEAGLTGVHMVAGCGPGKSFPSSHAVNNFAVACIFAFFYPRWKWALFGWASLVALSRPALGVHYPSDILGGAIIGSVIAFSMIAIWKQVHQRFLPSVLVTPMEKAR